MRTMDDIKKAIKKFRLKCEVGYNKDVLVFTMMIPNATFFNFRQNRYLTRVYNFKNYINDNLKSDTKRAYIWKNF